MSQQNGSRLAPFLLRLAVGLTFLWAGAGKFRGEALVAGEDAATLANMGVLTPLGKAGSAPATTPPDRPAPKEPLPADTKKPPPLAALNLQVTPSPTYTAADFPAPVKTTRVYSIAAMLARGAAPAVRADGTTMPKTWPPMLAGGRLPIYFAWAAALSELLGGGLLVVGLLTRVAGLATAGTMAGALWLTQIGPAIQQGNTRLGFIPNLDLYALDASGYTGLLWPLVLLAACLALALQGGGALALDNILLRSPAPAPRPAPPKPAP